MNHNLIEKRIFVVIFLKSKECLGLPYAHKNRNRNDLNWEHTIRRGISRPHKGLFVRSANFCYSTRFSIANKSFVLILLTGIIPVFIFSTNIKGNKTTCTVPLFLFINILSLRRQYGKHSHCVWQRRFVQKVYQRRLVMVLFSPFPFSPNAIAN